MYYEAVGELGKADQLALFKAMKQDLYPKEENKMEELLPKIKESRFSSGLGCLHCGSTAVKRNGKYRSRQRYLCKDCGKTFNDMTNTPFSGSRYPEKWIEYIKMMINGVTLPKKHLFAYIIGAGFLLILIYLVNDADRSSKLFETLKVWSLVLGIDFIISISYFIWPRGK